MITATFLQLAQEAPLIVAGMLDDTIIQIDNRFGRGYAKRHPELVAAFLAASENNFSIATLAQQIRAGLDNIADSLTATQK